MKIKRTLKEKISGQLNEFSNIVYIAVGDTNWTIIYYNIMEGVEITMGTLYSITYNVEEYAYEDCR